MNVIFFPELDKRYEIDSNKYYLMQKLLYKKNSIYRFNIIKKAKKLKYKYLVIVRVV